MTTISTEIIIKATQCQYLLYTEEDIERAQNGMFTSEPSRAESCRVEGERRKNGKDERINEKKVKTKYRSSRSVHAPKREFLFGINESWAFFILTVIWMNMILERYISISKAHSRTVLGVKRIRSDAAHESLERMNEKKRSHFHRIDCSRF